MQDMLHDKVEATLERHRMLDAGDRVVVAVSGGPDSVVLLHVLHRLCERWRISLITAHLNHGLRGSDSDGDAAFVEAYAGSLDMPCIVEKADVNAYCKEKGRSMETGARELRYAFLERVARAHQATKIATGHTADDQAETVLMRLLRGSGPDGLSGIRPVRDGRIIRPLLDTTREEIVAYQAAHGLAARHDASNTDQDILRNSIRGRLMPMLREEYNPEIQGALARLADVMREESEQLDRATDAVAEQYIEHIDRHILSLDLASWTDISVAMQRRLIRRFVGETGAQTSRLTYEHIERTQSLCQTGHTGQMLQLPGGIEMEHRKSTLLLCRGVFEAYQETMAIPGETPIPGSDFVITTAISDADQRPETYTRDCAVFDADALPDRLLIRSRLPGDRMTPFEMNGTKSLKKLFNEADIPRLMRDRIPVVTDGTDILWVAGYRRSNCAPVTATTRKVIIMQMSRQAV